MEQEREEGEKILIKEQQGMGVVVAPTVLVLACATHMYMARRRGTHVRDTYGTPICGQTWPTLFKKGPNSA